MRQRLVGKHLLAWVAFGLAGVAVHLVFWSISEPRDLFSDFYKAYYPAAKQLWQFGPRAGWPLGNAGVGGFVNIPIVAYLFVPLLAFGETGGAWGFFLLGAAASLASWVLLMRLNASKPEASAFLLFLFLINGPMVNSLKEGNTTHIVLFFLVVGLLLWRAGSEYTAGLVFGFCAVIKLPLLLFGVYFALRERWMVVAGGATMICLAIVLSLAVHGVGAHISWYESSIEPFLGKVIPALNVQSLDGFLMRLYLGEKHLFDWAPHDPATAHKIARILIFVAILGGLVWLARRAVRENPGTAVSGAAGGREMLDFSIVLILAIISSPVSWTHYYLFLLLPWGLYIGGQLPLPTDGTTRWLMRGSIVLSSLPVVILQMDPGLLASITARTAISSWLFGGLLSLAAFSRGVRPMLRDRSGCKEEVDTG